MRKKVILILTFILPVVGIVMFNFFSQSHFDIPIYYQNSVPQDLVCSGIKAPYVLSPDLYFIKSDGIKVFPFSSDEIKIFSFDQMNDHYRSELNKIADQFLDKKVKLYDFGLTENESDIPVSDNIHDLNFVTSLNEVRNCVFLIKNNEDNAVLIDNLNQIRGYYNLMDGELTDSLIVETKILLHQIEHANNNK